MHETLKTVQAQDAPYAHSKLHKRSQCVLTIADTFTPPISNLHACKTAEKACPLLLHLYASWLCENVVLDDWQLEGLRVCLGCIQNVPCPQDEKVCAQAVSKMYPIPKVKKYRVYPGCFPSVPQEWEEFGTVSQLCMVPFNILV